MHLVSQSFTLHSLRAHRGLALPGSVPPARPATPQRRAAGRAPHPHAAPEAHANAAPMIRCSAVTPAGRRGCRPPGWHVGRGLRRTVARCRKQLVDCTGTRHRVALAQAHPIRKQLRTRSLAEIVAAGECQHDLLHHLG